MWTTAIGGYPNGITLTPDGSAVVVAQSHPEDFEGGRVWRIPIEADGSAGVPVVMAELFHTVPDGVAYDVDGNCYVAHYTPDRIDRILPDGSVETVVEDWEAVHLNAPTNIAFCGPDLEPRGRRVRGGGVPRDRRPRRARVAVAPSGWVRASDARTLSGACARRPRHPGGMMATR